MNHAAAAVAVVLQNDGNPVLTQRMTGDTQRRDAGGKIVIVVVSRKCLSENRHPRNANPTPARKNNRNRLPT
jgi:hypothetical protein